MTKPVQTIISTDVAEKMYDLIKSPDDTRDPEFLEDEEIVKRLQSIKMSLQNHDETVKQNKNLQTSLRLKETELAELKKNRFFRTL